ncbi:hypothetical protein U8335_07610 [Roseiconus lacunae]|uniref:hypothetical protein n=1 Tax=Roseiconus lacunae TaxID=2605694 RepID=UPI0030928F98|nr:hypothetical protein U8335_07610 [Stieleria sp. HD01]
MKSPLARPPALFLIMIAVTSFAWTVTSVISSRQQNARTPVSPDRAGTQSADGIRQVQDEVNLRQFHRTANPPLRPELTEADKNVRQVNWMQAPDAQPMSSAGPAIKTVRQTVLTKTIEFDDLSPDKPVILDREFDVELIVPKEVTTATMEGKELEVADAPSGKKVTIKSTSLNSDGKLRIQLNATERTLYYRLVDNSQQSLKVYGTTHSRHRELEPAVAASVMQVVYLSNARAFLRIGCTSVRSADDVEIYRLIENGGVYSLESLEIQAKDTSNPVITSFDVAIPGGGNAPQFLLIQEVNTNAVFRAKRLVEVTINDPSSVVRIEWNEVADQRQLQSVSTPKLTVVGETGDSNDIDIVVVEETGEVPSPLTVIHQNSAPDVDLLQLSSPISGGHTNVRTLRIKAVAYLGDAQLPNVSAVQTVNLLRRDLVPQEFLDNGVGVIPGRAELAVRFPAVHQLVLEKDSSDPPKIDWSKVITLTGPSGTPIEIDSSKTNLDAASNSIQIGVPVSKITPGRYRLTLSNIKDQFGNELAMNDRGTRQYVVEFGEGGIIEGSDGPAGRVMPGIYGSTGKYVPYSEFTEPRDVPDGFNPNDKVETRVARLYFFRDAHRVAQIINRKVKSHNRHGVSVNRQLADQARTKADQLTQARQQAEREAIRQAGESRRIEEKLSDVRRNYDRTVARLQREAVAVKAETDEEKREAGAEALASIETTARQYAAQIETLEGQLDSARQDEVNAREVAAQQESKEELARQEQFRREVAAAHADPDTYAEGVPNSDDPIEQVSISVIGEGLIHLRGPLKGINQIRMMINQIDSPVGQVRINVHSTQINGDDAERLEVVSSRIQTYVDQARFLTVQSAEMLRKSVAIVAAHRAEEARALYPGSTQHERDQRYLYSFFGKDFIDELLAMDSEFLQSGNKLISLHSMDVTSLSSALLMLALADNNTRQMILEEFQRQLQSELPIAEQRYIDAGMHLDAGGCGGCGRCTDCQDECHRKPVIDRIHQMWKKHHGPPPLYSLSQNAAFQSLSGFFDATIPHGETMTPLQREFIALAQIFKSRLVTELEYKQRVMERALIEDRLGNRTQELRDAKSREDAARVQLNASRKKKIAALEQVVVELTKAQAAIRAEANEAKASLQWMDTNFREFIEDMNGTELRTQFAEFQNSQRPYIGGKLLFYGTMIDRAEFTISKLPDGTIILRNSKQKHSDHIRKSLDMAFLKTTALATALTNFQTKTRPEPVDRVNSIRAELQQRMWEKAIVKDADGLLTIKLESLQELAADYAELKVLGMELLEHQRQMAEKRLALLRDIRDPATPFELYYQRWNSYRNYVESVFANHDEKEQILAHLKSVDLQFDILLEVDVQTNFRLQEANAARRPLDHKKFLDMLIDDLEEKYIELLEGTRAHTANIDNYLKRLTTALDDDFNTQFYHPTFRSVRQASQFKDVEFGQTETTNVLANNRAFSKVSPSATMEFDLPQRDILIREGLDSALAIYSDVGALINDPNLLALAASQSGNSPSAPGAGTTGGFGAVRSVLPGVSGDTSEAILAQNAGTRPRYESNVEKLIPDPAIYKFETGTGFEIRPVIEPDGQAVVFDFNYMYTTNVREPVRADEKHLGRVKRHFIDTDVQLANFELREVSRYVVALKAERTANGVPLLEDIPVVGALWRPLPNAEKSLQQNIIMAQATIFPTLFDLMGLRWAPAVADLDPLRLSNREFIVRGRHRYLENRVYDVSSSRVDEFLRVPESERRSDLYRSQSTIPSVHPNGYRGDGLDYRNSELREGYQTGEAYPNSRYVPDKSSEGSFLRQRTPGIYDTMPGTDYPYREIDQGEPESPLPEPQSAVPTFRESLSSGFEDGGFGDSRFEDSGRVESYPSVVPMQDAPGWVK